MTNEISNASVDREQDSDGAVDLSRRRMGSAGAVVLLTLPSRSVMAASTCTASEIASGNLSRAGTANPCGCSPGFWGPQNQNGTSLWQTAPKLNLVYPWATATFNAVFGVPYFENSGGTIGDSILLHQVFPGQIAGPGQKYPNKYGGGSSTAMLVVAALLNAQYYGSRFPIPGLQTPSAVIAAFQTACAGPSGTVASFASTLDIYKSTSNLWCSGSPENGSGY
ncbi:MAG: hypothetical protein JO006_04305 [Paucibacter sp.]|nr:hypothetical protein [Roseateles sp.]